MGVIVPDRSSQSLLFVGILALLWPASASLSTTMAALNRGDGGLRKGAQYSCADLTVIVIVGLGLALVVLFNLISCATHCGVTGTLVVAATVYRIAPDTALR